MTPEPGPEANAAATSGQQSPGRDDPPLTDAELVQLRIRVIALENLVIAMLAEAPDRQRLLAQGMARYISPRAGFTPHPVTLRAADEMLSLVGRADRFLRPPPFLNPTMDTRVECAPCDMAGPSELGEEDPLAALDLLFRGLEQVKPLPLPESAEFAHPHSPSVTACEAPAPCGTPDASPEASAAQLAAKQ